MPEDIKPRLAAHQFRQVEGNDAGIVGDEAGLVRGPQFHQRHRPAAALLDHLDPTRLNGQERDRR